MIKKCLVYLKKYEEVISYLIIGGFTTVISIASYFIFSRIIHLDYKTATVLSWILSVLFAFFANKIIVFKSKTNNKKDYFLELFNFFKYRILSLFIDILSMMVFIEILHCNDMIAKIIVQFIIVVINYVFSKFLIFNKKSSTKDEKVLYDHKDYICFGICFLIMLLMFGIFLGDHFATDTIGMYNSGYLNNAKVYLNAGRIVMAIFLWLMDYFSISFRLAKVISWLIGFVSIYGGIITLYKILKSFTKNRIVNICTSILVVANIFLVEFFTFPEFTGIMCFSLFMAIMSASQMLSFFENNNKKNLLKSLSFSLLSMLSYQGTIALALIIPLIFTLHYASNFKDFIKKNVIIGMNYLIPCILILIYSHIIGNTRTSGAIYPLETIKIIYSQLKYLIATTQGALPVFVYAGLIFIVTVLVAFLILKSKDKNKKYKLLFFIYCLIAMVIVPLAPFAAVQTNLISVVGRSAFALGSIIGLIFMFYICYISPSFNFEKLLVLLFIVITLLCTYSNNKLALVRFTHNKYDKQEALKIIDMIKDYEKENNITVSKIGYCRDQSPTYTYIKNIYINDMTVRGMEVDWSSNAYLSYYSNHKFTIIDLKEEIIDYCSNNNWDSFQKEQILFDGDALYICIY